MEAEKWYNEDAPLSVAKETLSRITVSTKMEMSSKFFKKGKKFWVEIETGLQL